MAAVLLCTALSTTLEAATRHPNVVVILSDDQGWGDFSLHGNTNLATPHLDSLARDGAQFKRFYVSPVCSPTRAEFLTGRYHPRGAVWNVSTGGERLNLDEVTIADLFKRAGYATGAFGKWHNGTQYPYHPNGRGFDEYYGFTSGHWGEYFDAPLDHNGKLVRGRGYMVDDLTDHAISFIESHRQRPFFCYLALNVPHTPFQVPDRFWNRFKDRKIGMRHHEPEKEELDATRAALAMCENIDWNVGRLLQKLDQRNLTRETIVIYFNDNGPNSWRWNGAMKGRKGSTDEGGIRSPLFLRFPAAVKPGTVVEPIAGAIDLLPTLADLAGLPIPTENPLDGRTLKPLLTGATEPWPDRMIFSHWNNRVSLRTDQYRLDHTGKLFDMLEDEGQTTDVSNQKPEVAQRLRQAVAQWKNELLPGLRNDDRPFPVGYREFPITQLPARDGKPHGNVKRSAPAPNCSYFTNWTAVDDRITWDVEVVTPGNYEAVVYYACPEKDLGSRIKLQFLDSSLEARITQPHDPPLRGAEHDRVPRRGESYVKDFKPLSLGIIHLPKGRGPLALRAEEVAADQVMELRMLVLTLKQ